MGRLNCDVWDRKEWQKQRNRFKVPKGAANVSVGDALEKFHKARNTKSLTETVKVARELKTTLLKYAVQIEKKAAYKPLGAEMRKELIEGQLNPYIANADRIIKESKRYPTVYVVMRQAVQAVDKELTAYKNRPGAETFAPPDEAKIVGALDQYATLIERLVGGSMKLSQGDVSKFRNYAFEAKRGNWNPRIIAAMVKDAARMPGAMELV